MSCDNIQIQTTCSDKPEAPNTCIHFSSNCCYENNTFVDLSVSSVDVEFIFVPEEEGGFVDEYPIKATWKNLPSGRNSALRWSEDKKTEFVNEGYKFDDPVPICLKRKRKQGRRGPKLKGYHHPVEVCHDFLDPKSGYYPPYIYAFESKNSSLTDFKYNSHHIYLVKIGVPGHYTLGVIKIDSRSKSVDFEYFDPGGYGKYFPGRNQCLVREDDFAYPDEKTYLLGAICAFFRYKIRGLTFNFLVVNSLNLQISKRDEYCQTWILMYIYFKYILNTDRNVDFVLWLQ